MAVYYFVCDPNLSVLDISYVVYHECSPEYTYGNISRDFYQFIYVVSGKGVLSIENKEYHIIGNTSIIVFPGKVFVLQLIR